MSAGGDWLRGARRAVAGLRPMRVPEGPARAFRDLWPGDPARGARVLKGEFEVLGATRPLLPAEAGGAKGGSPAWRAALHGFAWLRDLRALGTDGARLRARALTQDWLRGGGDEALASAPDVTGARLSALLGHWDFLAETAEDGFRRALMTRLAHDARALVLSLPAARIAHRGALVALKGAVAASVALEEETWLARLLRVVPAEVERQVLPDGCHVERSPAAQLLALQDLVELRNLLHGAGVEAPPAVTLAIERAAPALRLFRHGDGGLALFNGTRDETGGAWATALDLALAHAQSRRPAPLILPEGGFHRLQAGRTLVIADCGRPPPRGTAPGAGADRVHHAGTLSFEMSVGRDRLVCNCGAAPAAEGAWRDALRATAAHSTLVLDDTNSAELREEGGLGARRPERVEAERQEAAGAQWLEATHDGWRKPTGATHRRRLWLSEAGDELRGEDIVEGSGAARPFAVRFHLHPLVEASDDPEVPGAVVLRPPSGAAWRLRTGRGARLAVEESVSVASGGGEPRPARQVALHPDAGAKAAQWSIARVAPAGPGAEAAPAAP